MLLISASRRKHMALHGNSTFPFHHTQGLVGGLFWESHGEVRERERCNERWRERGGEGERHNWWGGESGRERERENWQGGERGLGREPGREREGEGGGGGRRVEEKEREGKGREWGRERERKRVARERVRERARERETERERFDGPCLSSDPLYGGGLRVVWHQVHSTGTAAH